MFPFTFKIAVPGISNPFVPPPPPPPSTLFPTSPSPSQTWNPRSELSPGKDQRRQRPRSSSPAAPITRKRGWEPSYAEPSQSATTLASSTGYLDTPAKYRHLTTDEFDEIEAIAEELPPPAKRRRGLAGSIVSTAVSAALIGTAVGLTVYRLWRDRGKESQQEQIAPPPYHPGAWTTPIDAPKAINVLPPTPRRKTRQHAVGSIRRTNTRRTRARVPAYTPPPSTHSVASSSHSFSLDDSPDDQMDWIGDKLAALIAEGQKALGREIVVASDAPEDEVDDGSGAWEEEDEYGRPSSSRHSKRARLPPPSYTSPPPSASARSSRFDLTQTTPIPVTPRTSVDKSIRFDEDERTWESPLLRESMEAARLRALQNRGLA